MTSLSATSMANDLSQYAWDYRPVFVFAQDHTDSMLREQINAFADQTAQLDDRDMALVSVTGATITVHHGPELNITAKSLRERYNIQDSEFSLVLVGKDTGVKLRRSEYTAPEDIYDLIDSMPMRMREMRVKRIR